MSNHQQLLDRFNELVDEFAQEVCDAKLAHLDAPEDEKLFDQFHLERDLHGYLLDARYRMSVRLQQHEREALEKRAQP